jgi:hypothetical protein
VPAADALCRAPLGRSTRSSASVASSKDDVLVRPERLASVPCSFRRFSPVAGLLSPAGGVSDTDACNLHEPRAQPGSPEPRFRTLRGLPRPMLPGWPLVSFASAQPFGFASMGEDGPVELPSVRGLHRHSPVFTGTSSRSAPAFAVACRLRLPSGRSLAPRLVTPTSVTRTPSVVNTWREGPEEPLSPSARSVHPLHAHQASPLTRFSPPGASLSQDLPAGLLPSIPREENQARHTQGAFHRGPLSLFRSKPGALALSGEGGQFSTGCSQPVDISPAPFQPLPDGSVLTDVPGQGLVSW